MKLLRDSPTASYDVVVLSMGANDATGLCAPLQWAQWQNSLAELIAERFAPKLLVHSAVPPMHACKALPQPLRWFMGRWARKMNTALARQLADQDQRTLHWHPETTTSAGMALDGIHPSSDGYAAWADGLSRRILEAEVNLLTHIPPASDMRLALASAATPDVNAPGIKPRSHRRSAGRHP